MSIDASTPAAAPSSSLSLPYASARRAPGPGDLFAQDATLIALNGVTLPSRCILCGSDGWRNPVRLTFTWDASFHVTRESTLQLREQAAIHAFLCIRHRSRWSLARLTGAAGTMLFLALLIFGLALGIISESSDVPRYTPLGITLAIAGFAGMIFFLFIYTLRTQTLSCRRIHDGYLYLEGASPAFLARLAPLPPEKK